jgi:hypothetical protein
MNTMSTVKAVSTILWGLNILLLLLIGIFSFLLGRKFEKKEKYGIICYYIALFGFMTLAIIQSACFLMEAANDLAESNIYITKGFIITLIALIMIYPYYKFCTTHKGNIK